MPKNVQYKKDVIRNFFFRELSIFARCPEGYANLQLIDIFQLDWREIRTEEDLLSHSEHLRHGPEGQSCLLGEAESKECLNCFNKLNFAFERLAKVKKQLFYNN